MKTITDIELGAMNYDNNGLPAFTKEQEDKMRAMKRLNERNEQQQRKKVFIKKQDVATY